MRPEDAKRLLDDPNLKEVFQMMRERFHKEFEKVTALDKDEMQVVNIKLRMIADFYSVLRRVLSEVK